MKNKYFVFDSATFGNHKFTPLYKRAGSFGQVKCFNGSTLWFDAMNNLNGLKRVSRNDARKMFPKAFK